MIKRLPPMWSNDVQVRTVAGWRRVLELTDALGIGLFCETEVLGARDYSLGELIDLWLGVPHWTSALHDFVTLAPLYGALDDVRVVYVAAGVKNNKQLSGVRFVDA